MNTDELQIKLREINIPEDSYSINNGERNESLCLDYLNNQWEIYYSEKGAKTNCDRYESEEDACHEFFLRVKKMLGMA